jgi:hypothetical protein
MENPRGALAPKAADEIRHSRYLYNTLIVPLIFIRDQNHNLCVCPQKPFIIRLGSVDVCQPDVELGLIKIFQDPIDLTAENYVPVPRTENKELLCAF